MNLQENKKATQYAESRTPERGIARCQICGLDIFASDNFVKAHGGAKGAVIYGHSSCCDIHSYSTEVEARHNKKTLSGFCWGCEFETNDNLTKEQGLQLFSWYGLIRTQDCTVSEELKSLINQGLHGAKAMFDGIQKIVDISSGSNCGTHANVSLAEWSDIPFRRAIMTNFYELFNPLFEEMRKCPYTTERVWGRGFRSYCSAHMDGEHGDWLAVKSCCLEFRIARFQSTTQYFHLLCFLKEVCLIIDKWYLKKDMSKADAEKAGKKIFKKYEKHCNGTNTYFSKERNS